MLLVAGGSGVVPLMSMIRARAEAGSRTPFRLVYSVRSPETVLYAAELAERAQAGDGLEVSYVYTRSAPPGSRVRVGRLNPGGARRPRLDAGGRARGVHLRADRVRRGRGQPAGQGGA